MSSCHKRFQLECLALLIDVLVHQVGSLDRVGLEDRPATDDLFQLLGYVHLVRQTQDVFGVCKPNNGVQNLRLGFGARKTMKVAGRGLFSTTACRQIGLTELLWCVRNVVEDVVKWVAVQPGL